MPRGNRTRENVRQKRRGNRTRSILRSYHRWNKFEFRQRIFHSMFVDYFYGKVLARTRRNSHKITKRLSSREHFRECCSACSPSLAGRQISSTLTFSSKNEKRQRLSSQGLVSNKVLPRWPCSPSRLHSHNSRPVFVSFHSRRAHLRVSVSFSQI